MKKLHSILLALAALMFFGGSSLAGTSLYRCFDQSGHNVYTDSPAQLTHCGKLIVKVQENTDVRQKNETRSGNIIVAQMGGIPQPPSADPLLQGTPFPEEEFPALSPENTPSDPSPYPEGGPDSISAPSPGFGDGIHTEAPSPMTPESPEGAQPSPEFSIPGGTDSGMHPE
jgi:hypothetical protein